MNNTAIPPTEVLVIRAIYSTFLIAIFIFGIFGNTLTIIVLRDKRLSQSSTAVYLTALAVVDIFYLTTSLLVNIINTTVLFPQEIRSNSAIMCYTTPFFSYLFSHLSVWLMVAVTVDRAIWVTVPFQAKLLCTKRNAAITIMTLTIVLFGLDSHFFWTLEYIPSSEGSRCTPTYFSRYIFPYIDLLLLVCIPFVIMLAANILIGWQLKKMRDFTRRRNVSKDNRPTITQPEASSRQETSVTVKLSRIERKQHRLEVKDSIKMRTNSEKSSSLTAMLFAVSVFFMVSVSPLMIYDIIYFAIDLNQLVDTREPRGTTLIFAIERSVYTLWYTNFAIHFVLYCLNGPPFRARAMALFRCHRARHSNVTKHLTVHPEVGMDNLNRSATGNSRIENTRTC